MGQSKWLIAKKEKGKERIEVELGRHLLPSKLIQKGNKFPRNKG
jgi:hypothetical protein